MAAAAPAAPPASSAEGMLPAVRGSVAVVVLHTSSQPVGIPGLGGLWHRQQHDGPPNQLDMTGHIPTGVSQHTRDIDDCKLYISQARRNTCRPVADAEVNTGLAGHDAARHASLTESCCSLHRLRPIGTTLCSLFCSHLGDIAPAGISASKSF